MSDVIEVLSSYSVLWGFNNNLSSGVSRWQSNIFVKGTRFSIVGLAMKGKTSRVVAVGSRPKDGVEMVVSLGSRFLGYIARGRSLLS